MKNNTGQIIISIMGIILIILTVFFTIAMNRIEEENNKYSQGFYQYMIYIDPKSKKLYTYDHGKFEPLLDSHGNQIVIQEEKQYED